MSTPSIPRTRLAIAASVLTVGLVAGGAAAIGLGANTGDQNTNTSPWQTSTSEQLGQQPQLPDAQLPEIQIPRAWQQQPETTTPQTTTNTSTATTAQSAGVVEITSTLTDGRAAGTGMVLTSDGTVVTNHHVVAGATSIQVTVPNTGKTYTATYVGGDATKDVAVLKLADASDLTTVDLTSVDREGDGVAVGDAVTAVGDANGDGGSLTAAPGTVTAKEQSITVQDDDGGASRLTGLLELTADLVPGDSGGAVLDGDGQVVAMNVAASTGDTDVTGYAIPLADVQEVVRAVLAGDASGTVDIGYHGYLGVALDSSSTTPLVVSTVSGGAAAKAGITAGDTITAVDGTSVGTAEALRSRLAATDPGDQVRISWTSGDGSRHSATVVLGRAPVA